MATITALAQASTALAISTRQWKTTPILLSRTIDFAAAATAKGSALASADVIEVLRLPDNVFIEWAGLQVIEANVGGSSDVTLDVGITGVDADQWVDGYDYDAAAAGAVATPVAIATTEPRRYLASSDTIDILIATATTAPTGGKVRVFALVTPVKFGEFVGLAQIGD